jgi:hypothetical protein
MLWGHFIAKLQLMLLNCPPLFADSDFSTITKNESLKDKSLK